MKGNYAGALSAYFSGLRINNDCKAKHETGRFYNNIANVYCVFGDYVKGLSYYKKGYEFAINTATRPMHTRFLPT